jgi:hypothetical protein
LIEGSEGEGQWDIEEDEEFATLTRLLAEGIPLDTGFVFQRVKRQVKRSVFFSITQSGP